MDAGCKDGACKKIHVSVSAIVVAVAITTVFCCGCTWCLLWKHRRKFGFFTTGAVNDQSLDTTDEKQNEANIEVDKESKKDEHEPGKVHREDLDSLGRGKKEADKNDANAEKKSAVDRCEGGRANSAAEDLSNGLEGELKHILELGLMEHWLIPKEHVQCFETIGEGGFGSVRRGLLLGSTEIAVKFNKLDVAASTWKALINEVQLFRRLRHPNIVMFHGVFVAEESSHSLGIVLEWVAGGNFRDHCRNRHKMGTYRMGFAAPERQLMISKDQGLLVDTARGMLYLHALDPVILHRDLKPANILVDTVEPPRAKLTDFGISILMEGGKGVKAKAGTKAYMAPEVKNGQFYNTLADVFSFGCVIFFLLSGQNPPPDGNILEVAKYVFGQPHLPVVLCKTSCSCLQFDPSLRPSFVEIFAILNGSVHGSGNSGTSSTPSDIVAADVKGASKSNPTGSAPEIVAL